ncbi:MAG: heme NO-binding domain-containing protein [Gemmatimonadaceae bacterium]
MHGIIFAELKKFVHRGFGEAAWLKISENAGVTRVSNLATESYPDAELFALVGAASRLSGIPVPELLNRFGEFIVPDLVKVFSAFLDKNWGALDLLEHTESVIHRAVRLQDPKAEPPKLRIRRTGPDEVTIVYTSARKLCAVAAGIIRGVATHYGESISVEETTCMHHGAPQCTLIASRVQAAAVA